MPIHREIPFTVSWEQASAFRLARHHLLDRAPAKDLVSVAGEMGGAQAQLVSAAQLSLGIRHNDLEQQQVEKAMAERKLVKASCMRQTLFLVPARELMIFSQGAASRARREVTWALRKGVPEKTVHAAIDATLSVLDQPLTRNEIAERVSRKMGVQKRDVRGGGWGSRKQIAAVPVGPLNYPVVYLIHIVTSRGIVCYGPPRGSEPTFVRADAWVPKWRDIAREDAEDALLRRYLKSFGPAAPHDFAAWSGMTLTETRTIWDRQQGGMLPVNVENKKVFLLQEDVNELLHAKFERPLVRLLPYFDSFIIGHKERDHLVSRQHHAKVSRPQGWIAPTVIANGRIVGVWEHDVKKDRLFIRVKKIQPLTRAMQNDIRAEAQQLGRFLKTSDVEVQIG